MKVFVDLDEPVKYILFKIRNSSGRLRKLTLTGYVEWVLGELRYKNRYADYNGNKSGNRYPPRG